MSPKPKFLILADREFSPETSKTANSIIRYMPEQVVGVVDRVHAGKTVQDVLGFGGSIPVVATMEEGLQRKPTAVLIGIAPSGGRLPDEWEGWLADALDAGCDLWSGLHTFLADDPILVERAKANGRQIRDVRRPPARIPVAAGMARKLEPLVVLSVGTDCNVGKMTAQLQLVKGLEQRGLRTRFVATGQTGIFIEGWGIAVDAVIADFIAGAAEEITVEGARNADVVLVEGQGSINHPGYSGVTVGLLHGSCPDALILCHQASREFIGEYRGGPWLRIPPLSQYVKMYELIGSAVHPTRVIGISMNTYDLSEEAARRVCAEASKETGLPCTDPVRFSAEPLLDAIQSAHRAKRASRKP